jgi:hypothetical protein
MYTTTSLVGDVRGADRLVVAQDPARHGVEAVGGEDDRAELAPTVVHGDRTPLGLLVPGHGDVVDQLHPCPAAGVQQRPVQVAAMDHHVGEAVTALHVPQVEPGEDAAFERVLHEDALGEHAERLDLVEQAPVVEYAGAVGGDLQAGADLAEPVGLFEHPYPQALPGECQGVGQAADATAHHHDVDVAALFSHVR